MWYNLELLPMFYLESMNYNIKRKEYLNGGVAHLFKPHETY